MRASKSLLIIILLTYNSINCQTTDYNKYSSFILHQLIKGEYKFTIIDDSSRLHNPNKYYSIMLFYKEKLVDSVSLSDSSGNGSHIKSIFNWRVKDKIYPCLEYNYGSGIGKRIIYNTKLSIYDIRNNKLFLLLKINTDSLDVSSESIFNTEVNAVINHNTPGIMYLTRRMWVFKSGRSNNIIKRNIWNKTYEIQLDDSERIECKLKKGKAIIFY
jgi:hypothetical protein